MDAYKLVVVDDEPIIRLDIKEMLEEEGYKVVAEGRNGEEAVDLVYRINPDLIIMDIKMPKMDGVKASKIIREFSDSAILLLTAYSQRDLVQRAKESGVLAYIVKPFSENDLIPAIEMALAQRERLLQLKKELKEKEKKLQERIVIEKTKGEIMKKFSMPEDKAYRWMRSEAMSHRMTIYQWAVYFLNHFSKL